MSKLSAGWCGRAGDCDGLLWVDDGLLPLASDSLPKARSPSLSTRYGTVLVRPLSRILLKQSCRQIRFLGLGTA